MKSLLTTAIVILVLALVALPVRAQKDEKADQKAKTKDEATVKATGAASADPATAQASGKKIKDIKDNGKTMAMDDWKAKTAKGGGPAPKVGIGTKGKAAVGGGGAAPRTAAADVNGDGRADRVVGGGAAPPTSAGDLNGDGKSAVGGGGAAPRAMGDASAMKAKKANDGKGTKAAASSVEGGHATSDATLKKAAGKTSPKDADKTATPAKQ